MTDMDTEKAAETVSVNAIGYRKLKETYRLIFENTREGIGIYEELPSGKKLVECNSQYIQMSGYSREELKSFKNILEVREELESFDQDGMDAEKVLANQKKYSGIFSWKRPDGKENYVEYTAAPIKSGEGRFTIEIGHDITKNEMAELALRETEEKYRILTNVLNIGVYQNTPGPKGKFMDVNNAHVRIFGYKNKDEMLSVSVADLYQDPADRKRFSERLSRVGFVDEELHLRKKDGTPIICQVSSVAMRDQFGEVKHFDGIVQDITDRKRAEEELRESEKKYRLVIENSNASISILTTEGIFIMLNNMAAAQLGGKPEDFVGRSIYELFPKDAADEYMASVRQAVESRKGLTKQRNIKLPGGEKWFSNNLQPVIESDGAICQVQVISQDITEYKHTEEALRESLKRENQALKALQESVERENQAFAEGRLEIVDTILHNIGNAINSVTIGIGTAGRLANNKLTQYLVSLADAIKQHQDDFSRYVEEDEQGQKVAPFIIALAEDLERRDEELEKAVSRVQERAQHVSDIILTVKQISGRPSRKEIGLRKAVEAAETVLQDSIIKRGILTITDFSNAPENINIQESQFHQMLLNLMKNSIEAIDELRASESLSRKTSPLFSADLTFQDALQDGIVPVSLIKHFRDNRLPLSNDARISVAESGRRWQISDAGRIYTVRKERDKLNIYAYFIKVKCYTESESLVMEVSDNGIGLDENMLEIIFRAGYSTKNSGMGLGLHSIAVFVKGCDGQIEAFSDGIGKGATMRVVLPLAQE